MKKLILFYFFLFSLISNAQIIDLKRLSNYQSDKESQYNIYKVIEARNLVSYIDEGNKVVVLKIEEDTSRIFYTSNISSCNEVPGKEHYALYDSVIVFLSGTDLIVENMITSEVKTYPNIIDLKHEAYLLEKINNRTAIIRPTNNTSPSYVLLDIITGDKKVINNGHITLINDNYCYLHLLSRLEKINLKTFESEIILNGITNTYSWINSRGKYAYFQIPKPNSDYSKVFVLNKQDSIIEIDSIKGELTSANSINNFAYLNFYEFDEFGFIGEKQIFYNFNTKRFSKMRYAIYDDQILGQNDSIIYITLGDYLYEYNTTTDTLIKQNIQLGYVEHLLNGDSSIIVSGINNDNSYLYLNLKTKTSKPLSKYKYNGSYPIVIDNDKHTLYFNNNGLERNLFKVESDSLKFLYTITNNKNIGLASRQIMKSQDYIFTISSNSILIFDSLHNDRVKQIPLPEKLTYDLLEGEHYYINNNDFYFISSKISNDSTYERFTIFKFDLNNLVYKDIFDYLDFEQLPKSQHQIRFTKKAIQADSFLYFYDLENENSTHLKTKSYLIFSYSENDNIYYCDSGNGKNDLYKIDKNLNNQTQLVVENIKSESWNKYIYEEKNIFNYLDKTYFVEDGVKQEINGIEFNKDIRVRAISKDKFFFLDKNGNYSIYKIEKDINSVLTATKTFNGNISNKISFGDAYFTNSHLFFQVNNREILGSINLSSNELKYKSYYQRIAILNINETGFITYNNPTNDIKKYDFNFNLLDSNSFSADLTAVNYHNLFISNYEEIQSNLKYSILSYDKSLEEIPIVLNNETLEYYSLLNCQNNKFGTRPGFHIMSNGRIYFVLHNEENGAQFYSLDNNLLSTTGYFVLLNNNKLCTYPNPVTGDKLFLKLDSSHNQTKKITVTSINGVSSQFNVTDNYIDVSKLVNGIYHIAVVSDNKIYNGKFIVQK